MDPSSSTALTKADLPEIIQRYLDGESIQSIAKDARVARNTIYQWIHFQTGPDYQYIVRRAMVRRMADADHDLWNATTKEDIARAREECRYTRWDLERRWSDQFGVKQEVKERRDIKVIIYAPQVNNPTVQPIEIRLANAPQTPQRMVEDE